MNSSERNKPEATPQDDLDNEERIQRILHSGTPDELEKLRKRYELSDSTMDILVHYAKLREEAHLISDTEMQLREKKNPQPTDEELEMGSYVEGLEPQVRHAVVTMRQKGYSTFESGFYGENLQTISCEEDDFKNITMPDELLKELRDRGVDIEFSNSSMLMRLNKKLSLSEIKECWDAIVKHLPNLDKKAKVSLLPAAEDFRSAHRNESA